MKNPATTIEHDVYNDFTRQLKIRLDEKGVEPVTLRDGRILLIEYFEEGEYKMFRYVNDATNTYLVWELCGRSVTSRSFDIVEME